MVVSVLDKGFVHLKQHLGTDRTIPEAARASFAAFDEEMTDERIAGMIRFMMDNKHGSVFEHCVATFHVKAPLVAFREWHRHRAGFSYNEQSGRYSQIEAEYYVPEFVRHQVGKPGAYTFEPADKFLTNVTRGIIEDAGAQAFALYENLLDLGVAKEQARLVLPVNMYSQMWVTANLRAWMNFLELRTSEHAMFEIREYANAIEGMLTDLFPIAMTRFIENGRIAP